MADQKQYQAELAHLKDMIPKRVKLAGIPGTQQRELTVHFPDVNQHLYAKCEKALEVYCWPSNPKPQRWVENPKIDGLTPEDAVAGRWRLVRVEHDRAKYPGLMVTLREGYATSLQWDEAMLSAADWLQESERYADIVFPNIDPLYIQAIVDALPAYTTTPFTVAGHAYAASVAAPWDYIRAKPEQQDDGSFVLRLFVAQPRYTQVLYDNYGCPDQQTKTVCSNVPKRLAASVVATYNLVEGASGTANYSTQQGTVDLIFYQRNTSHVTIRTVKTKDACEYDEYTDYWYNYTRAEADAFDLNSVYGAFAQGYEFSIDSLSYAGGGRYTVITKMRHVKAVNHGTVDYERTASAITTVQHLSGQTSVPAATIGTGFFEWIRAEVDRFCTWTVQKFRRTSTAWTQSFSITDENGQTEAHTIAGNQRTIAFPSVTATTALRLSSFSRNEQDGTFNWHVAVVPRRQTIAATYTLIDERYQTRSFVGSGSSGTAYVQRGRMSKTIEVAEFTNVNDAIAFAGQYNTWNKPWDEICPGRVLGFKHSDTIQTWDTVASVTW